MSDKNGGPAFPHEFKYGDGTANRDVGMTLRDYFAAKALQGFIASTKNGDCDLNTVAKSSYLMADAMLKARQ
jgi:hypothetical protein